MRSPSLEDLARRLGGKVCADRVLLPTPGHSPRDRGTIVSPRSDGRGFVVHAFNNPDWREVRAALRLSNEARALSPGERRRLAQALAKARAEREARQIARCVALAGDSTAPAPGSPVRAYLAARGIPAATAAQACAAGALREHRDDRGRVTMLAPAHDSAGRLRAVQLTKLKPDGSRKRGADIDRLTFGPVKGAACRLLPVEGETLAICEGVETALAFAVLRGVPCWATFGASNLRSFEPPRGVRTVIIGSDGDAPGREAAEALFDRLRGRLRVLIASAPAGLDWNDVALRFAGDVP